jgi:hypothetical protein
MMMIRSIVMLLAVIASGMLLLTSLINPISHISQQQQQISLKEVKY